VQGSGMTVCSVGNMVCLFDNAQGSMNEIMDALKEAAHE